MANEVTDFKTLNSELFEAYQTYLNKVFEGGVLDDKAKAVATVAAALALGDAETIGKCLPVAKEAGLGNEEIGHIAAIITVLQIESKQAAQTKSGGGGGGAGRSSCC